MKLNILEIFYKNKIKSFSKNRKKLKTMETYYEHVPRGIINYGLYDSKLRKIIKVKVQKMVSARFWTCDWYRKWPYQTEICYISSRLLLESCWKWYLQAFQNIRFFIEFEWKALLDIGNVPIFLVFGKETYKKLKLSYMLSIVGTNSQKLFITIMSTFNK